MKLISAGMTHVGNVRGNNEDNLFINGQYSTNYYDNTFMAYDEEERESYLYAVCDGIGGCDSGEVASLIAVQQLDKYYNDKNRNDISEYVLAANDNICEEIKARGGGRMGSTFVGIESDGDTITVCNVGDSKAFRYRQGKLEQISKDHNRRQQLLDAGLIKSSDDKSINIKNVLTQSLGIFEEEFVISPYKVTGIELQTGDIFILCSDGLTDMVTNQELIKILDELADGDVRKIVEQSLQLALDNGGRDNTTIIAIKVLLTTGEGCRNYG